MEHVVFLQHSSGDVFIKGQDYLLDEEETHLTVKYYLAERNQQSVLSDTVNLADFLKVLDTVVTGGIMGATFPLWGLTIQYYGADGVLLT